jgi:two-component system, cell cycle sensor histidine kinase and response regulator CckA
MSYPRVANPPSANVEDSERDGLASQLLGVISHLNAGIIAFGPSGRTLFCSERVTAILGIEPDNSAELLGALGATEVVRKQIRQAMSNTETEKVNLEIYCQERPLNLTICTLEGELSLRAVIIEDRAHELEHRRRIEHLERLANVGQITAGAAHEFNNNLTSVLGWTQIAMQNTPPDTPAASALEIIEENAQKAKSIFSRLLEMSRSKAGGDERILASPENVMNDALDVLAFELRNARIDLHRRFKSTRQCYLDTEGLGQVIVNIVRNAIDAMPDGGRLDVGIEMDDENLQFIFEDNGPGMPPDVAAQVFDEFFTTKRDSDIPLNGGTGLGLSISRDIVKRMGGEILVESIPRAGTTFTVTIPHTSGAPLKSTFSNHINRPTIPPGAIVLVVDDEPDIGEMIRTSLELQGVSVIAVNSGEEAVAQLGRIPFDAAFVDYTMPGLSGHALGLEMQKAQPNLPIVFMSGLNVEIDQVIGDFIKKPFDLDEIQKKLYEVMKRRKEALIEGLRG